MFHRTRTLQFLGALIVGLCVSAVPATADELGKTPEICDAYAPTPLCFYPAVSGTDTFNLSTHILHVGQELTGTYKWLIGGQGSGEIPAEAPSLWWTRALA